MAKTKDQPEEKQFSLKPIEMQMIQNLQDRANSALFDFCTFIAIERLAFTPDKDTSFRVENGNLYIGRVETQPEAKQEDVAVS